MGLQEQITIMESAMEDLTEARDQTLKGTAEAEKLYTPISQQEEIKQGAAIEVDQIKRNLLDAQAGLMRLLEICDQGASNAEGKIVSRSEVALGAFTTAEEKLGDGKQKLIPVMGSEASVEHSLFLYGNPTPALQMAQSYARSLKNSGEKAVTDFKASHESTDELVGQLGTALAALNTLATGISTAGQASWENQETNLNRKKDMAEKGEQATGDLTQAAVQLQGSIIAYRGRA